MTNDDEDARRVKVGWYELVPLINGAHERGWSTDAQRDYLLGCIRLAWTKGYRAGERAARAQGGAT